MIFFRWRNDCILRYRGGLESILFSRGLSSLSPSLSIFFFCMFRVYRDGLLDYKNRHGGLYIIVLLSIFVLCFFFRAAKIIFRFQL